MNQDLADYYSKVGHLRAKGLDEEEAHSEAERAMEATMNHWNMQNIALAVKTRTEVNDVRSHNEVPGDVGIGVSEPSEVGRVLRADAASAAG